MLFVIKQKFWNCNSSIKLLFCRRDIYCRGFVILSAMFREIGVSTIETRKWHPISFASIYCELNTKALAAHSNSRKSTLKPSSNGNCETLYFYGVYIPINATPRNDSYLLRFIQREPYIRAVPLILFFFLSLFSFLSLYIYKLGFT